MSPREQPRLVAEQPAREKKSDATRARILDAAYSVLAEKGYATTSMADIARAANTQAGAMYYYFKSKDALVEALMFRESDRAQAMTLARLAALPAGMGHQERFMNLVQAGLSYSLGRESDEIVTFMRMLSQVPYPIRDRVVGKSNYEQHLAKSVIQEGQAAGEFRSDFNPSIAAFLLMGSMLWRDYWQRMSSEHSIEELTREVCQVFLAGIESGGPQGAGEKRKPAKRGRASRKQGGT